ncbi:MAG: type I-E CRISPR-associated protein Cse1/CasA [Eubacteriales bacterium]|nr:type I-E CRISPR-associated protein Cse1/CasA [Eubacteriales bacterium]
MDKKEFNLLKEPWIRVLTLDGHEKLCSLIEVFEEGVFLKELSGELPTQNFAIYRLLLAILHAAFGKREDGMYPSLDDGSHIELSAEDLLLRWKTIWNNKSFPEYLFEYLDENEDRFWLFHPERPFFQVSKMPVATSYDAAKLNGELSESANKIRLFPLRTGKEKQQMTYAEAARWLLHVNAFDDTSAKPRGTREGKLPSPGAGWLGRLGLIIAEGDNLFETLLLNWVLLTEDKDLWGVERPTWQADEARTEERVYVNVPDNQSELLTLQSRRLLLQREGTYVTGYLLLGGDILDPEQEVGVEQMTIWRKREKVKEGERLNTPRRHNPERQLWRDIDSLLLASEDSDKKSRIPGVVSWLSFLMRKNILKDAPLILKTASIQYGDKDFFAADVFEDKVIFARSLIREESEAKRDAVIELISWTDDLVKTLGSLARQINFAEGGDLKSANAAAAEARRQGYFVLDIPFRHWLSTFNTEKVLEERESWQKTATNIIRKQGEALVHKASYKAIKGRTVEDKSYSSAQAFNYFLAMIKRKGAV